jgi:hypothetical protein
MAKDGIDANIDGLIRICIGTDPNSQGLDWVIIPKTHQAHEQPDDHRICPGEDEAHQNSESPTYQRRGDDPVPQWLQLARPSA